MQSFRHLLLNKNLTRLRFFSSDVKSVTNVIISSASSTKSPKFPRYTPQNQQLIDDYMIPGPALRFFKNKREKKKLDKDSVILDVNENLYTSPARSIHYNEFDSTPTIAQERLAERIKRGISTMYSVEALPTELITLGHISIREVKVSRNLRRCQVIYEPLSKNKKARGNVHRALDQYSQLLNVLIRQHAQLKRPLSFKFVPDTQSKELEAIYQKISMEEENSI